MADVVRLEELISRLPKRTAAAPCEAKILLFTGVRYERWNGDHDDHHDHHNGPVRRSGGKGKKH